MELILGIIVGLIIAVGVISYILPYFKKKTRPTLTPPTDGNDVHRLTYNQKAFLDAMVTVYKGTKTRKQQDDFLDSRKAEWEKWFNFNFEFTSRFNQIEKEYGIS